MAVNFASAEIILPDGTDITSKINPRLIGLSLTEKRGGEADQLDITIQNHDGLIIPPARGITIPLSLGWLSGDDVPIGLVQKGTFKVDEVERSGPPDMITIRARSGNVAGTHRKRQKRIWKNTTLGAIVNEIAAEDGQSSQVESALSAISIDAIEQGSKSNKLFIRDLGQRYDALATWKNDILLFIPIGSTANSAGQSLQQHQWTKSDGFTWRFAALDINDYDGAEAEYHDQESGEARLVKTGGNNRKRLQKTYANHSDAMAAATAEAARSKRAKFEFTFDLAFGDASIIPNAAVSLSGWDSEIDGINWIVHEVAHKLNSGGLQSDVTLQSV